MTDAWQPIESAPRDGTWFLVYLPEEGAMGTIHAACNKKALSGFVRQIGHNFDRDLTPATHWHPMIAAPHQEGVGG